jgi:hypothetical protein
VGSPTARITPHWMHRFESGAAPRGISDTSVQSPFLSQPSDSMPCVLYESDSLLSLTDVSESVFDLLGFKRESVIGWHSFWGQCVLDEDLGLIEEKFRELNTCGFTAFIHRMLNASGLPVWVSHSLRKTSLHGQPIIRGCLVPIGRDRRIQALDQNVVARFVHKLGNHFQLLSLVSNSLKKAVPESRETEILQETIEKAIELTRIFSDCNQLPSWMSEVQLIDVIKAAAATCRAAFVAKNVAYQEELESVLGVTIVGDPFLLEIAFGHLLENALDATSANATVKFKAESVCPGDTRVATLRVTYLDGNIGVDERPERPALHASKIIRDNLDLSIAARLIEMHGGLLRTKIGEDHQTEIKVSLPLDGTNRGYACA